MAELEQATPTREALDRAMGERRAERTLTLATSWPRARERDLAWANRASLTAHRSVNGYDPMVPASRLAALDGMGSDGTVSRRLLETDPGRLELLGVRWIQVPTEALVVPADGDGLGEALDVVLQPPRPHLFSLPITRATEVRVVSFLSGAVEVEQGRVVAECVARLASGREIWLPIRAGIETAEWAWERPDVRRAVRHEMASVHASFPAREGFTGHQYLGVLRLQGRFAVSSLRFRAWPGAPPLWLLRAGLRDAEAGRGVGLSAASAYVSDEVRLAEAAGTPLVSLFEVRRGIGPAWVVESLRRLPDEARVLDVLRSPTRLGVDARREALATETDARGVVLPPGSRSSPADLARAAGGRIVVRAAGPGLLVIERRVRPRLPGAGGRPGGPRPARERGPHGGRARGGDPPRGAHPPGAGAPCRPRPRRPRGWPGSPAPSSPSAAARFDPPRGRVLASLVSASSPP